MTWPLLSIGLSEVGLMNRSASSRAPQGNPAASEFADIRSSPQQSLRIRFKSSGLASQTYGLPGPESGIFASLSNSSSWVRYRRERDTNDRK
jgi:hypothetical protein